MICQEDEELAVVFESQRELPQELPETLKKLQKDRRAVTGRVPSAVAVIKLVTKGKPVLFDEDNQAIKSAEVRVQKDLS